MASDRTDTPVRLQVDTVQLRKQRLALMRRLNQFDRKIQRRVLRKAARAGGAVMKKAVKDEVPKVNRTLDRSIDVRYKTYPNGNVAAVIGQDLKKQPRKSKAKRPRKRKGGGLSAQGKTVPDHFVAMKIKRHQIGTPDFKRLDGSKVMRWEKPVRFAYGVRHRGHRGDNFLERAYMRSRQAAQNATDAKLTVEIDAEAEAVKGIS